MLFLPEGLQRQDNLEAQIDLLPKLTPNILKNLGQRLLWFW